MVQTTQFLSVCCGLGERDRIINISEIDAVLAPLEDRVYRFEVCMSHH